MTRFATVTSTCAKTLLAGAALALFASGAGAQVVKPDPTMGDAANAPLEDLNVAQEEIPPVLVEASLDPYEHESLRTCNDIRAEIAAIDRILGADFDIAEASDRDISAGRIARTLVRSFIPFRRIIREISGAEDRERQIEIAVTASMVRRGYLKGLGQARGCDYPSRPHEDRIIRAPEAEGDDED